MLSALGVDKSELFGSDKQTSILSIINNKKSKPSFRGFICIKCNKEFDRIPLIGICECGGEIKLLTDKGTVDRL